MSQLQFIPLVRLLGWFLKLYCLCTVIGPSRLRPPLILLCCSLGGITLHAEAQQASPTVTQDVQTIESSSVEQTPQSPNTDESKANSQTKKKKERRGAIVVAPIPISSPAIGTGVVLAGGYIFPFRKADMVSPPSVVGGAALFTNNGSRALALAAEFYLKQNTYHITSMYVRGNLNYDFYGVGTAADQGKKLPLKQTGQVFLGEILYRIAGKFFVGPRALAGNSTITLRPNDGSTVPPPPDLGIDTGLTSLGIRVNRDTRANRFYPTQGTLFDFTSNFFSEALGSKYSFQAYRSTFNYYRSFGSKQVLAYNLFLCATAGNAPFYGECVFGTNNQLRGYVAGQFIDRDMIATQLEYRRELVWRFGVAVFGGLGEVAPSVSQFRYDNILPAVGGGVRFKLSRKYNVNFRADIAQGKDGHTFSMGIGEAF